MEVASGKYFRSRGDSPARNLRSRTGFVEKAAPVSCYELPPTPGTPLSIPIPAPRSTRSTIKRFYNSPLEEELDLVGKSYPACSASPPRPSGLQTPQHFMSEDSPNKFLDLDTPDKNKVAFALQETAPLSFDCVLDTVPPLNDYSFSGLMEQMMDGDLSTPQHSPLSPPYSNETTNPYTPFTDSEPPPTPHPSLLDDEEEDDEDDGLGHTTSASTRSRKRRGGSISPDISDLKRRPRNQQSHRELRGRKRKEQEASVVPSSSPGQKNNTMEAETETEEMEGVAVVPAKKNRRKSPIKELRMFPRIEMPSTPEESEWHKMRDGGVKELRLVNFMCHKNKHWKFGPHLNIITGENGSGKTAIQTSIMIVCGAKASTTGRADSLQMVIQRGESYAMIELVLSNHNGTHSKRRYGEEIRLRKQFSKSSSTTKVQLRDGTWFLLKKAGLDSLLRPLQIHLNNPVQILTQKVATNFLNTQEAVALYKSFKDITQITSKEECLQSTQNNIIVSKSTLPIKFLEFKERKRRAQEAEDQFRKILEMERYKGLCAQLRIEKSWSVVIQIEAVVAELSSKVAQIESKIEGIEGEQTQLEESKANMVSSHEKEKSMLSELRREAANFEAQHDKAHEALREVSKENQNFGKRIKLLNDGKAKLQQELNELERQRRDSLSVKANDDERIKTQTEEEIRRYELTIQEASRELGVLRAEKQELEEQQATFKEKEEHAHSLFQESQTKLKEKIRGLKNIQDAEITKYDKFGNRMKTLVKRIAQCKWQGKTPVGPLGAWFTVKKEHETYAAVIEETLGRTLRTFATDHPEDVNTLRHLIQEVFGNSNEGKPGIISVVSSNREGQWWSKGKAIISGCPTILDVLDIQHPKVTEALIEKEQIEKIILFKTEQEACSIFKDAKSVPRTCVYGVSKDCFKFTPSPNYKVQPLQQRKKAYYLQTTKFENAREALESEIEGLKADVAEINDTWQHAKKITTGFARQVADCEKKIKQKSDELNRAKSLLRGCEQILADLAEVPDMASQNDFIEEQKRQLELTLAQREEELVAQLNAKEECDLKLKERETESKAFKVQLDEVRKRIQACDDEKGVFQKQCDKLDKKIKDCDNTLKSLNADKKKLQKELAGKNKESEQKCGEARKKGERVTTTRSPEDIQADLEGRENFYKQNLHKIKMKEEVRRMAKKWKKSANEIHVQIEVASKILGLLEPLTTMQKSHLERTKLANLTNFQNYYLIFIQLRGYTGQALFDIEDEKLFYYVSVDKKSEVKAQAYVTRNSVTGKMMVDWKGLKEFTMQLSGGERSFSTMAYISALRQIMPTPFFMLDEFEVFMDGGNKRVSMGILVEQAHSLFDAQFFVFTPHEPDELPQDDPYIKYFKLEHSGRNLISTLTEVKRSLISTPKTPAIRTRADVSSNSTSLTPTPSKRRKI